MCGLQVLSNSYAFAFFFFGGEMFEEFSEEQNRINQGLFEDRQEQLAQEVRVCDDVVLLCAPSAR
jgi:ariadne-1